MKPVQNFLGKEPSWLLHYRRKNALVMEQKPLQKSRYSNLLALERAISAPVDSSIEFSLPIELEEFGLQVFSWKDALKTMGQELKTALKLEPLPRDQFTAALNASFGAGFVLVLDSKTPVEHLLELETRVPQGVLAKTVVIARKSQNPFFLLEAVSGKSPRWSQTVLLEKGARLVLARQWTCSGSAIVSQSSILQKNSFLHSSNAWLSDARIRAQVFGALPGAYSRLLQSDWSLEGKGSFLDLGAAVWHKAPSTASRFSFKSVLEENASGVFDGMVKILPAGQKASARLEAHSLLLNPNASINLVPCLEIEADDVQASHSASVSQLDSEALFYLESRGLSEKKAKELLVKSFLESLVHELPPAFWPSLENALEKQWNSIINTKYHPKKVSQ